MKRWLVVALTVAAVSSARAEFMMPEWVPVERVLSNIEARVKASPKDAEAHYTLARAHYLAFAFKVGQVPANDYGGKTAIAPQWMIGGDSTYGLRQAEARRRAGEDTRDQAYWNKVRAIDEQLAKEGWKPATLGDKELIAHAAAAMAAFKEAIRLEPSNGLYELGVASLIGQWCDWSESHAGTKVPADLTGLVRTAAATHFRRAYDLAVSGDLKNEHQPVAGVQSLVSYESGKALLKLAASLPGVLTEADTKKIEKSVAKLEKLPIGAITPLIVPVGNAVTIDELVDSSARVAFDLSGMGLGRIWPWLRADRAGFLVWQSPKGESIVSGRQLFGGYTFRLFWRDGFDALASLDDNHDGMISGSEREGLFVWFDRNSDGRSEPSELASLDELGIVSLATAATGKEAGHPVHRAGVTLRDGTTRPLWDWMPTPVE